MQTPPAIVPSSLPLPSYAYVSYMANDRDLKGVLLLQYNLTKVNSRYPYYVILVEAVSQTVKDTLRHHGIQYIEFPFETILQQFTMDHALIQEIMQKFYYGKYLIFMLTRFQKIVYLDTDLMLMDNVDELFSCDTSQSKICMVYDMQAFTDQQNQTCLVMTRNAFNSGVIVAEPSEAVGNVLFQSLVQDGIDGFRRLLTDQCIFNRLHNNGQLQCIPIHPKLNLSPSLVSDFLQYNFMDKPFIIHFMLKPKPWDVLDGTVAPFTFSNSVSKHLYHLWINTYQEMIASRYFLHAPVSGTQYAQRYFYGGFSANGGIQIDVEIPKGKSL